MRGTDRDIHELVRETYAEVAKGGQGIGTVSCCCGTTPIADIRMLGNVLDYQDKDLTLAPGEANLGLGCGNPIGQADLKPGEIVLDLGSGAGFDAFLAAREVGPSGRVIGVDMTGEMVEKAERNAERLGVSNVEFRRGKIESLPLEDGAVDVVISNCVINLSPDKMAVFGEIHRVLKPGGRMIISDVLRSKDMPEAIRDSPAAYAG